MPTIPASVLRRVNRVRERIQPENEPEEILDDIFVLCRAFEATWSDEGGESAQAQEAVVETIADHGIEALPQVRELIRALGVFRTAPSTVSAEWFGTHPSPAESKARVVRTVETLREAAAHPRVWSARESRDLGRLIYRMRCAVVHPSLDTNNDLGVTVLPALRDALIELVMSRTSTRYGLSLAEARAQFDGALR